MKPCLKHELLKHYFVSHLLSAPFTNQTFINVTLLDINDNAPQMPAVENYQPIFEENSIKGFVNSIKLIAPDKDDPNLPNSWVLYEILEILPGGNNIEDVSDYENLFSMIGDGKIFGQMVVNKNLEGYYGEWVVKICAYDQGIPQQISIASYIVVVNPYNFHSPKIFFPKIDNTIRLCSEQNVNQSLKLADCSTFLQELEAYDPDGGVYGDIIFSVDNGENNHFRAVKDQIYKNKSSLQLTQKLAAGIYNVDMKAEDGGYRSDYLKNLKIVLIDLNSNPFFRDTEFITSFTGKL